MLSFVKHVELEAACNFKFKIPSFVDTLLPFWALGLELLDCTPLLIQI